MVSFNPETRCERMLHGVIEFEVPCRDSIESNYRIVSQRGLGIIFSKGEVPASSTQMLNTHCRLL